MFHTFWRETFMTSTALNLNKKRQLTKMMHKIRLWGLWCTAGNLLRRCKRCKKVHISSELTVAEFQNTNQKDEVKILFFRSLYSCSEALGEGLKRFKKIWLRYQLLPDSAIPDSTKQLFVYKNFSDTWVNLHKVRVSAFTTLKLFYQTFLGMWKLLLEPIYYCILLSFSNYSISSVNNETWTMVYCFYCKSLVCKKCQV